MGAYIDRTGMRFGYLTVLKRLPNQGKKVKWLCKCDCGEECEKRSDALNNNSMCPQCELQVRKGFKLKPDGTLHPSIKNEIGNKYGKLTVIDIDKDKSQTNRGIAWKCQCECGNYKSVFGNDLRSGAVQSCGCLHKKEEQPGTKYGKLTIIKRIENTAAGKIKYLCQCDCGNYCEATGSDLRNGQQQSCGCIKSKGEEKISYLLQQNNIQYIKEKTFNTCKDINTLPFDFYINNNYLIEYDGKQHFSIEHAWNDFSFEQTQKHDKIKNQWCKENNIPLIRIPYTRLNDLCIEDLMLETSQFIV
ncbi:MAG: hypothetical protein LIO71_03555 [Ruminococcus sp.]|nr:hypothetical protein [Ruminococcus sp.]